MGCGQRVTALDADQLIGASSESEQGEDDDGAILDLLGRQYRWREIALPFLGGGQEWWHPGLAMRRDGTLLAFDQGATALTEIAADGAITNERALPLRVGHGITIAGPDDTFTWIADPGIRSRVVDGEVQRDTVAGEVICADAAGNVVVRLEAPPLAVYRHEPYRPTSTCVLGSGDDATLWIADGYGQSVVHRYDAGGGYLGTIDGTAGAGRFDCPHGLLVDSRGAEPRVLIADRGNAALRAYSPDGEYLETLGAGVLTSPSGMATSGQHLVVAELRGRLAVFDENDTFSGSIGDATRSWQSAGWPNELIDGRTQRPSPLLPGTFNSPHAVVADATGRIVVAEWLLGGRLVSLDPVNP